MRIEGTLEIVCHRAITVIDRRTVPNILTNTAVEAVKALLAGGYGLPAVGGDEYTPLGSGNPVSNLFAAEMRLTDAADPSEPLMDDTDLEGETVEAFNVDDDTLSVEYPSLDLMRFVGTIPAEDHVGVTLREEGLFSADGKLIARALTAKSASGVVEFGSGLNPETNSTITLHDGVNQVTFRFVEEIANPNDVLLGPTATHTRENLRNAIAATSLTLETFARSATVPGINLTNTVRGSAGNQNINTTSGTLVVDGMSSGANPVQKTEDFAVTFRHRIKAVTPNMEG